MYDFSVYIRVVQKTKQKFGIFITILLLNYTAIAKIISYKF